jgi:hypothetical protein
LIIMHYPWGYVRDGYRYGTGLVQFHNDEA